MTKGNLRKSATRSRTLGCRLFLIAFLVSLLPGRAATADSSFAATETRLTYGLRTTRTLPRGTNLLVVKRFLEERWVLKSDVTGQPVLAEADLASLYLSASILSSTVVAEGFPVSLADTAPPTRRLLTFIEPSAAIEAVSLCKPYEPATILAHSTAAAHSAKVAVTGAILVAHDRSEREAIVVAAVRDEDATRIEVLRRDGYDRFTFECLDRSQYE